MLREFTTLQRIFRLVEESAARWRYNHSGVGLCATILSLNDDQLVTILDLELLLIKEMSYKKYCCFIHPWLGSSQTRSGQHRPYHSSFELLHQAEGCLNVG